MVIREGVAVVFLAWLASHRPSALCFKYGQGATKMGLIFQTKLLILVKIIDLVFLVSDNLTTLALGVPARFSSNLVWERFTHTIKD